MDSRLVAYTKGMAEILGLRLGRAQDPRPSRILA